MPVSPGIDRPLVVLLRGHGREPAESAAAAAHRRAVYGDAILRLAADDALAAAPGRQGPPQASPAPDAALGPAGGLPTAQDISAAPGAQDLPVPASRSGDHAAESGVVLGRDVYSADARAFSIWSRSWDWASRKVLSWRLSNTLESSFCVEALDEALERYGPPEIFNTDQGSQFTSLAFTDVLKDAGIHISMDGKGRWMDNVFIERLWRSLKYEQVYSLRQRDAPALAVMRELAGQYPRYGDRKIRVFLARRGHPMSAQRAYRLWHQAGLQVPRRRPAPAGSLPPRATAGPDRDESRVGLRLRLRYVRGWPGRGSV